MSTAELPLAIALPVALLVLAGALLTLIGALGLLRLPSFFQRLHAPTMGTTLGTGCVLIASMLLFSALASRPVLHEIAIGVFMTLTTPVTFMLLLRAAVQRSRGAPASTTAAGDRRGADRHAAAAGGRPAPRGAADQGPAGADPADRGPTGDDDPADDAARA